LPAQDQNLALAGYCRGISWPRAREDHLGDRPEQSVARWPATSAAGRGGFLDADCDHRNFGTGLVPARQRPFRQRQEVIRRNQQSLWPWPGTISHVLSSHQEVLCSARS